MLLLSPKFTARLPVRIDISWMKPREAAPVSATALPIEEESPERASLVSRILHLNPTAGTEFLQQFTITALEEYLEHLHASELPRGRRSGRLRPDNTPGVIVRTARF